MSKNISLAFEQGKAVSDTNVFIAANKILGEYAVSALGRREPNIELLQNSSSGTVTNLTPRSRLDRLDRSLEVQNACECLDMENPESFKKGCNLAQISPAAFSYLVYALSRNESVVNLRNLGIGPNGALVVMHKLMKDKPAVTELDISSNNLCDSGTAAICKYLATNDTITKVDFSGNSLQRNGTNSIANMLTENRKIKTLVLSHNGLSEETFELVASQLKNEQTLENLDLSSNSFTSKCGCMFSYIFAKNITLVSINLSCNYIGDEGIQDLIPGLKQNGTLLNLDLSWNVIGDEGVGWIAEFLSLNNVLRHLNLGFNRITTKGVKYLAKSLSINSGLEFLELSGNNLSSEDAVISMDAISKNTSLKLKRLYLGGISICSEIIKLLNEVQSKYEDFEVFGMVNAVGESIKITSQKNPLEALESYITKNDLIFRNASLFIE